MHHEFFKKDPRTGQHTAIGGPEISFEQREACRALNRGRTRGILEGGQRTPPGESVPFDVWAAALERGFAEWGVPLVSLERLGLRVEDSFFSPVENWLRPLPSGAEASPFLDVENGVVYKFFDVRNKGALGKKVNLAEVGNGGVEIQTRDANLRDTLEKLSVLHGAGAHATEIVGLEESGHYLIAKQPLAEPMVDFEADRLAALEAMKAVKFGFPGLRHFGAVVWILDRAWLVADLHERNIMRDAEGRPTVIDALTGTVPPSYIDKYRPLAEAVEDAQALREGGTVEGRKGFLDVEDGEL